MPEAETREVVSAEALRRGTIDRSFQDAKSDSSQKEVANDCEGSGKKPCISEAGTSSLGSPSQRRFTSPVPDEGQNSTLSLQPALPFNMGQGSSVSNEKTAVDAAVSDSNQQLLDSHFGLPTIYSDRTADQLVGEGLDRATVPPSFYRGTCLGPCIRREHVCGFANSQDAGSDVPTTEDPIAVVNCIDHTTIVAGASSNVVLAVKAEGSSNSLVTSYKMKEPRSIVLMVDLPPENGNFYPDSGPGFHGVSISNGTLRTSSCHGDMVDGSKQSIWATPTFALNSSSRGGINSSVDVYFPKSDDNTMHLLYGEDGPQVL